MSEKDGAYYINTTIDRSSDEEIDDEEMKEMDEKSKCMGERLFETAPDDYIKSIKNIEEEAEEGRRKYLANIPRFPCH